MELTKETALVQEFIRSINTHSVEDLMRYLSRDHKFVDSIGSVINGYDDMKQAWETYFELFPDYRIEVADILGGDEVVMVIGRAKGTYSGGSLHHENSWEIPAAFYAVIHEGLIREWRVFADNEPVRRILEG